MYNTGDLSTTRDTNNWTNMADLNQLEEEVQQICGLEISAGHDARVRTLQDNLIILLSKANCVLRKIDQAIMLKQTSQLNRQQEGRSKEEIRSLRQQDCPKQSSDELKDKEPVPQPVEIPSEFDVQEELKVNNVGLQFENLQDHFHSEQSVIDHPEQKPGFNSSGGSDEAQKGALSKSEQIEFEEKEEMDEERHEQLESKSKLHPISELAEIEERQLESKSKLHPKKEFVEIEERQYVSIEQSSMIQLPSPSESTSRSAEEETRVEE